MNMKAPVLTAISFKGMAAWSAMIGVCGFDVKTQPKPPETVSLPGIGDRFQEHQEARI